MANHSSRVRLTAARVQSFSCPSSKSQAFLWDTDASALVLRATPTGRKTYAFESRLNGNTIRISIGTAKDWTLEQARHKASELKVLVDSGQDPRLIERQQRISQQELQAKEIAQSITLGEAWETYLNERRPHWSDLHYRDHIDKAKAGNIPSKRRGQTHKLTKPGPLHSLMSIQLNTLDSLTLEKWAKVEGQGRQSSARLAWRLLTVFLSWCSEQPEYGLPANQNPAKTKKVRDALGKPSLKSDVLTREQLSSWFTNVQQIQNRVISAALQVMLLTGARPGEVLNLRWEDINKKWKGINIRDKIEGTREIPLTPYVSQLISELPHRNEWVFSSARMLSMDAHNIKRRANKAKLNGVTNKIGEIKETSSTGRISNPNTPHTRACKAAGLDGLTLHGLRRSFSSLTEWLEIPTGVVAQIQGHKPSATAEKHYKRRPLDLLRLHHERIEAWMLEQASVTFNFEKSKLQAIN